MPLARSVSRRTDGGRRPAGAVATAVPILQSERGGTAGLLLSPTGTASLPSPPTNIHLLSPQTAHIVLHYVTSSKESPEREYDLTHLNQDGVRVVCASLLEREKC